MIRESSSRGAGALPQNEPHDEFLELCAASITGDLSADEKRRLEEHVASCSFCREALQQYRLIAGNVIPSLAATEPSNLPEDSGWSEAKAEKSLFDHLDAAEKDPGARGSSSSFFPPRSLPFPNGSTWRSVWVLYAAGILLFCALSFFAYRTGAHRPGPATHAIHPQERQQTASAQGSLEEQLSDTGHDRALAKSEIAQRDTLIFELRRQMARQSAEIRQLKATESRLEDDLHTGDARRQDMSQQKAELERDLQSAENNSQALQQKLASLAEQSAQDEQRSVAFEARVRELTRDLQEQQLAVGQRDEMLAKDRDIREVMGARDLYIAEIYDVAETGETKKPYGRVFYTRGKSLVFYAYDLDQQAGLRQASAFQAWGRRGPDRQQAINLGVFYEDNASKKRWILKCDDPKTLAQIDAVFVTIEPKGGSHKPSSRTLLFASLKIDPNHP